MIEFAEARWPLVTLTRRGRRTVADATIHLVASERFVRREELSAPAMVYADEEAARDEKEKGAGPILARWPKASRGSPTEFCRGIGPVVPDPSSDAAWDEQIEVARRAGGGPVERFTAIPKAAAWLTEQLAGSESAVSATATTEDARP